MNRFASVMEYILAALMIVGGVNTASQPVVTTGNIFAVILGGAVSTYVFAAVIIVLGVLLAYGKITRKNRLRSGVLFAIYLLMFYATVADIVVVGVLSFAWVDSVVFVAWSSWLHGRLNVADGATVKKAMKWTNGTAKAVRPSAVARS